MLRRSALAVDADGVAHGDLEAGASQVVLADVQVCDGGVRQRGREASPSRQRDLEVFAHVQRPDAPQPQHRLQVLQLRVQHALAPSTFFLLCSNIGARPI